MRPALKKRKDPDAMVEGEMAEGRNMNQPARKFTKKSPKPYLKSNGKGRTYTYDD